MAPDVLQLINQLLLWIICMNHIFVFSFQFHTHTHTHIPLLRLHSPGQSRASLGSGRSSGAEPETDVSDSSAAHFSLPLCSFAEGGKTEKKTDSSKNKNLLCYWERPFFAPWLFIEINYFTLRISLKFQNFVPQMQFGKINEEIWLLFYLFFFKFECLTNVSARYISTKRK